MLSVPKDTMFLLENTNSLRFTSINAYLSALLRNIRNFDENSIYYETNTCFYYRLVTMLHSSG